MSERILDASKLDEDIEDTTHRPKTLVEFIGQTNMKTSLDLYVQSAKMRNKVLDHVLLSGPPGLGKTTVANIIANELGASFISITGPSIKKAEDIISVLISLKKGDVLFVDEIHGLSKVIAEVLYPCMEDFKVSLTRVVNTDSGTRKEPIFIKLKAFTLIGATTRVGLLSAPFRDRFGIFLRFDLYNLEELSEIVRRTSSLFNIPITPEGVVAIASRSRGTPRIANRLTRRVRDVMVVKGEIQINKKIADYAFHVMRIDEFGLDDLDRKILYNIYKFYNNGPVGVKTIAMSVGEEVRTIEDVYEPYLAHLGFLKRTPGGREITHLAIEHLQKVGFRYGLSISQKSQKDEQKIVKTVTGNIQLINVEDMR